MIRFPEKHIKHKLQEKFLGEKFMIAGENESLETSTKSGAISFKKRKVEEYKESISELKTLMIEISSILDKGFPVDSVNGMEDSNQVYPLFMLEELWIRRTVLEKRYSRLTSIRQLMENTVNKIEEEIKVELVKKRLDGK